MDKIRGVEAGASTSEGCVVGTPSHRTQSGESRQESRLLDEGVCTLAHRPIGQNPGRRGRSLAFGVMGRRYKDYTLPSDKIWRSRGRSLDFRVKGEYTGCAPLFGQIPRVEPDASAFWVGAAAGRKKGAQTETPPATGAGGRRDALTPIRGDPLGSLGTRRIGGRIHGESEHEDEERRGETRGRSGASPERSRVDTVAPRSLGGEENWLGAFGLRSGR